MPCYISSCGVFYDCDLQCLLISGQNANYKIPMPKAQIEKNTYYTSPKTLTPESQRHKSVAFHTLANCRWHLDRLLVLCQVWNQIKFCPAIAEI